MKQNVIPSMDVFICRGMDHKRFSLSVNIIGQPKYSHSACHTFLSFSVYTTLKIWSIRSTVGAMSIQNLPPIGGGIFQTTINKIDLRLAILFTTCYIEKDGSINGWRILKGNLAAIL